MKQNPMMQAVTEFSKGVRTAGIIIALLMMALGVMALVIPGRTALLVAWLFLAGIAVYGLFDIVMYIKAPSGERQTWLLINGIFCLLLGVLALLNTEAAGKVLILSTALCFQMVSAGIGRITLASQLKKNGQTGTGMLTFSGIINILCAIFFITSPFMMTIAYEMIMGIYLIIGGITLLVQMFSKPKAE